MPLFTYNEITESRHYDKSEAFEVSLTVKKREELNNSQMVAWICFCVQRAIKNPDAVDNVALNAI